MKIYHNPKCRKSRQTLALIEERGEEPEVIKYLEEPPTAEELKQIVEMLAIRPGQLIRKNESIYKEQYKGRKMDDDDWIKAMAAHPKLIQRPIVIREKKAIIGRPPENVLELMN